MVAVRRPRDFAGPRLDHPRRSSRASCANTPCARPVRRTDQPSGTPLELRSNATYLVTGGLGSIGLEIAGYLAANGAGHLVLTSRRQPSEAVQRIDALAEQHGCEFRVVTADVADSHDVARLLGSVQGELPPLAGIVHAAGELGTTPLSNLDDAEVDRVFAGKVWGAWHLSEAAADLKLDFFISTSSIASVWGGSVRPPTVRPTRSSTGWLSASRAGRRRGQRQLRSVVGGHGRRGIPCTAGQRGVQTPSPADALAGLTDVVAGVSAQASSPGSTGLVSCRCTSRRVVGRCWRGGARGARVDDGGVAVTAPGIHRWSSCSPNAPVGQRKKLMTELPARRGCRGDARRRRGDPRGRRFLRPRHGFVDGSRVAAPHRARCRQGDSRHAGDGSSPAVRRGRLPAR